MIESSHRMFNIIWKTESHRDPGHFSNPWIESLPIPGFLDYKLLFAFICLFSPKADVRRTIKLANFVCQ